jgi:TonB family protein
MTALAQALSAALIDFVWQGLWMALALWVLLFMLRNRSPRVRYAVSSTMLAAMACLPAITTCLNYTRPPAERITPMWVIAGLQTAAAATVPGHAPFGWAGWLQRWALTIWALGVLLFSLRVVWAALRLATLRRRSTAPEAAVLGMTARLMERMHLRRPVRVLMNAATDSPSVVGWIRPVVLLPAAAILGLTPPQLEAVLAHEFAHILRYDYLVNMLQTVAETLLFYHPAVWWASARIRRERELCCDDLAVAACGDALCYARALTRLERMRLTAPAMALGSTGGPLLYRIRRIVGEADQGHTPSKLPGVLALCLGLLALAVHVPWARGQQPDAPAAATAETDAVTDDLGVTVNLGGATVSDREPVAYPDAAFEKGIQGTVVIEVTLDATGAVSDARVLSGPAELRKTTLESVLEWHFAAGAAGSVRQVSVAFHAGSGVAGGIRGGIGVGVSGGIGGGVGGGIGGGVGGGIGGGVGGGIGEGVSGGVAGGVSGGVQQRRLDEAVRKAVESEKRRQLKAQILESEAQLMALRQTYTQTHPDVLALEAQLEALRNQHGESVAQGLEQHQALEAQLEAFRNQHGENFAQELEHQLQGLQEHGAQTAAATALLEAQRFQMGTLESRLAEMRDPAFGGRRVKSIEIIGLSQPESDALLSRLPVQVGGALGADSIEKMESAMKESGDHFGLSISIARDGEAEIRITANGSGDSTQH